MQKNSITNKITPCCGLPFSVIYWWVSNLTLNSEADRQFILSKISQNGTIAIDGWKVLINSGTLETDASLAKAEFLAWFDCGRQPNCEQLKLIIEGFKISNWTPETELPSNLALIDAVVNGQTLNGNVFTKEQTNQMFAEMSVSGLSKPLKPTDATPTEAGWYKPTVSGTYANAGGLVAQSGYDTLFYFDDTTWSKVEVALPKGADGKTIETWSAKIFAVGSQVFYNGKIYEASGSAVAGDVPGASSVWVEKLGINREDSIVATLAGIRDDKYVNAIAFREGVNAAMAQYSEQINSLIATNEELSQKVQDLEISNASTTAKIDEYRFGKMDVDYYIAANGSDTNAGTKDLPFKSFAPLLAMASNSLDNKVIALRCGDTIDAMDDGVINAKNCVITSYGDIALGRPFLDCTDLITETWTEHSTGIWKVSLTHKSNIKIYPNFFKNGIPVQKVTSVANLASASDKAVYADNQTNATFTLYMKSDVNPSIDGNIYRWSKYGHAIRLNGEGSIIDNLHSFGNANQDGAFIVTTDNNAGGVKLSRCRVDWGNRHSALVGSGIRPSIAEYNEFYGGANDVETNNILSTGSANALVFNTPDHTQAVCIDRYNIYDGLTTRQNYNLPTALTYFTGGYGHDGILGNPMLKYIAIGNTYKNMIQISRTCSLNGSFENCVLQNISVFLSCNSSNVNYMIKNCQGYTDQIIYGTTQNTTLNLINNDFIIRDLGGGTAGWVRYAESSGNIYLTISGGTLDVQGIREGSIPDNRTLFRVKNGSLKINNFTIYPKMGTHFTYVVDIRSGGIFTLNSTSGGNTYPVGAIFMNAGVIYDLAGWISAGFEQNTSITHALPIMEIKDDFNRSDKLLVNDVYVNLGGSTTPLAIRNKKLATLDGTTQAVMLGKVSSQNMWVRKITESTVGSSGLALLVADQNNFILLRETSTQYQFQICNGGTFKTNSVNGITPAAGHEVIAVMRKVTDYYSKNTYTKMWIIVNNRTYLNGSNFTVPPALSGVLNVGFVGRGAANPLLSDASWTSLQNKD